jgi:hypothetical protein
LAGCGLKAAALSRLVVRSSGTLGTTRWQSCRNGHRSDTSQDKENHRKALGGSLSRVKDERFVATDRSGTQQIADRNVSWPLPTERGPGEVVEAEPGTSLALLGLDGMLEQLGERIFLAEALEEVENGVRRARLLRETSWTLTAAARFALDCAEHAVTDSSLLTLPSGASLGEILADARKALDTEAERGNGLVQRVSRLALARRLRHLGVDVGDMVYQRAIADQVADLDALDDPEWTSAASVRDAVLSAVEAIRHDALPWLFEAENRSYLATEEGGVSFGLMPTPWGAFSLSDKLGIVPAWLAARQAAERAREVAGSAGQKGSETERKWQLERLGAALGLGSQPEGTPPSA